MEDKELTHNNCIKKPAISKYEQYDVCRRCNIANLIQKIQKLVGIWVNVIHKMKMEVKEAK